ncbi:alanyl-tRNA editing protein [Vibrio sp. 10N.261.51.F12]|uniref:alanyl-tRNA editing protein n=1 Tax=Vibrio sp. 10N.261.51.F12 TaxID=3229679 RepID=UPI00355065AB
MITATKTYFCHELDSMETFVQLSVNHSTHTDIVVENTPFHPVSHIWPDHPADIGWVTIKGECYQVFDCLVGAVELATTTLYVGKEIPVKRDTEGWLFVVVHRVKEKLELLSDQAISLKVDRDYQLSLSRGHSAGHIASLALNKVLANQYWRKVADRTDGLGHYDFNSYAQEKSEVFPERCVDLYRLGKTLKKRGLNTADVLADLVQIESEVNAVLQHWLAKPTSIRMRLEGPYLTSSRYWEWEMSDAVVVMPCGGTHVSSTAELSQVSIELQMIESTYIQMHTYVNR